MKVNNIRESHQRQADKMQALADENQAELFAIDNAMKTLSECKKQKETEEVKMKKIIIAAAAVMAARVW